MQLRRPSLALWTSLGLVLALSTACTFDRSVALDSGTRYSRARWSEDPAVLWVSYQIEVTSLDGRGERSVPPPDSASWVRGVRNSPL